MTIDMVFIEGIIAGLGWGLLIGGVLGMRYLASLASEDGGQSGGGGK